LFGNISLSMSSSQRVPGSRHRQAADAAHIAAPNAQDERPKNSVLITGAQLPEPSADTNVDTEEDVKTQPNQHSPSAPSTLDPPEDVYGTYTRSALSDDQAIDYNPPSALDGVPNNDLDTLWTCVSPFTLQTHPPPPSLPFPPLSPSSFPAPTSTLTHISPTSAQMSRRSHTRL